jgi:hypothetical protein
VEAVHEPVGRLQEIVVDSLDPARLAAFYGAVLGLVSVVW